MALGALTLSTTQGVQGRPFGAVINGLTTGKVEVLGDGSPGFSTVNGRVSNSSLPYPVSTVVLREYEPGVGQGYRDSRIDITAATRTELAAQALASIGAGRVLRGFRVAGERQPDGSISYSLKVEDDLGATASVTIGAPVLPLPSFTTLPSISPTSGNVGATFTVSYAAANTTSATIQWLLNGSAISGANGASYLSAAAGGLSAKVDLVGPGGSATATSAAVTVTATPTPTPTPTPTTTQSSVTDTGPTGNQITYNFASPGPVGRYADGSAFAVNPTVSSISPVGTTLAAGVATYAPDNVTFTDSTNTVNQSGHGLVVNDQVLFDSITTTTGLSTGTKYYVVAVPSTSTFQIAATAGGAVIDLVNDGSGVMRRYYMQNRDVNGAAVNPKPQGPSGESAGTGVNPKATFHGLDELIYSQSTVPTEFPYSATLNFDPGKTGQPISGAGKTIVKARSIVTDLKRSGRERITDYSILTLVDEVPPSGSFRRWAGAADKTPLFTTADFDWTGYPSRAKPADAILPSKTAILNKLGPIALFAGTQDLFSRGTRATTMQPDYGGDLALEIVQAILFTMTQGVPTADRNEVAVKLFQIAQDLFDMHEAGFRFSSASFSFGGAHQWIKTLLMWGAWMVRNAANVTARNALASYIDSSTKRIFADDMMVLPVTREMIEIGIPSPGSVINGLGPTGFFAAHENAIDFLTKPSGSYVSFAYQTRYRRTNAYTLWGTAMIARLLGYEATWNNPLFFAYLDRMFNMWVRRGMPLDEARLNAFTAAYFRDYYAALSPLYQSAPAPTLVRRAARDQFVWFETDQPLDHVAVDQRPSPSDFTVTQNGQPVSLANFTIGACSAVQSIDGSNQNNVKPIITVPNAFANGVRIGMSVAGGSGSAALPPECQVVAFVDGNPNQIQVSAQIPQTFSNTTLTFSPVWIYDRNFGVVVPTAPANDQVAITCSYTPGTNPIRNLRGIAVPAIPLAATTNFTGRLPDAFTGTRQYVYGGNSRATRQFLGAEQPKPIGTVRKLVISQEVVWPTDPIVDDTYLSSYSGGTTSFRLYGSGVADLRIIFGTNETGSWVGKSFRFPGAITQIKNNIPLGTKFVWHIAIDLTATTLADMCKFVVRGENGFTLPLTNLTGSTAELAGVHATTIEGLFTLGMFIGGTGQNVAATNPSSNTSNAGFGRLILGAGGAGMTIPTDLTTAQFAYGADWGSNGQNVWGSAQQYFYVFDVNDANSKVVNRGAGGSNAMTPRRILDEETGELTTMFVAI